ncbi:NAD(P)H-dependent flavin oxidoreductase [Gemella morbillorum]|jgi:thiazole biosynthesis protein thiG|uniref:NAD(P)H-dependent flavin oxidoreductase n=1 Tax=Gemella morbillorum TaxID=29391 RepID=UPI00248E4829|nr:nitronate monooxygenase [Gemella morbillorum]MDK8239849.1 nitronate monooxygenase [Gemella morbillorum]MDK8255323.1 nitronate monooxygenase [Gemella morbillorum]
MTITQLLGIKYPIFQGAMAQIARYELASAVSNAGGLGILASGGMRPEELREQIKKCKEQTTKPFAVNLMLMMPNINEIIDVVIEEGVKIVTTGAGTPRKFMPRLTEAGVKVIPVIPSVKAAKKMEELGCAAVVVEGMEAGGHVGTSTTMALLPQVTKAVNIPVIAAGGIADGRGVAAAFCLGASGVQMGTVFLATHECPISIEYKNLIVEADDTSTTLTGMKFGAPVRGIKNELTKRYHELEAQSSTLMELEELTLGSLRKAVYDGDVENGSVMSGQIAGLVDEIRSVEQVIVDVLGEAKTTLANVKID